MKIGNIYCSSLFSSYYRFSPCLVRYKERTDHQLYISARVLKPIAKLFTTIYDPNLNLLSTAVYLSNFKVMLRFALNDLQRRGYE